MGKITLLLSKCEDQSQAWLCMAVTSLLERGHRWAPRALWLTSLAKIVALAPCICFHLLQGKASLTEAESNLYLWVKHR